MAVRPQGLNVRVATASMLRSPTLVNASCRKPASTPADRVVRMSVEGVLRSIITLLRSPDQ